MQRPINYEQTDPKWKNVMYSSVKDRTQTIGTSGCGPTCAAMVIAELTGKAVTPVETCKWAADYGYRTKNNGTSWLYFRPQMAAYGIECKNYTEDVNKAIDALNRKRLVICLALKGLWTTSGHYILAYGISGNTVYLNDPNSTSKAREEAPLSVFKSQCSKFWIVEEDWMIQKQKANLFIDGEPKEMNSVLVEGENYIRVRDLAPALGYRVDWDSVKKTVILAKEKK